MKKYTAVFLAAIMCMLTGCGEKSVLPTGTPPSETVADTSDIALPELTEEPIPTPTPAETVDPAAMHSTKGIDVDLTQLSSTMIYAEVYNMMVTPDEYVGKTVRMEVSTHPTTTKRPERTTLHASFRMQQPAVHRGSSSILQINTPIRRTTLKRVKTSASPAFLRHITRTTQLIVS